MIEESSIEQKERSLTEAIKDMEKAGDNINKNSNKPKQIRVKTESSEDNEYELDENAKKLKKFVEATKSYVFLTDNSGNSVPFPTSPAWSFLAEIMLVDVVLRPVEATTNMLNPSQKVLQCVAEVRDIDEKVVLTRATAIVDPNEDYLKDQPLNAAYALVQTRAKNRAIRNAFGHYMAEIGLQATPAEEVLK